MTQSISAASCFALPGAGASCVPACRRSLPFPRPDPGQSSALDIPHSPRSTGSSPLTRIHPVEGSDPSSGPRRGGRGHQAKVSAFRLALSDTGSGLMIAQTFLDLVYHVDRRANRQTHRFSPSWVRESIAASLIGNVCYKPAQAHSEPKNGLPLDLRTAASRGAHAPRLDAGATGRQNRA